MKLTSFLTITLFVVFLTSSCKEPKSPPITKENFPSETDIYSFMNNDLPSNDIGKSNWGIFFSMHPYPIDSSIADKVLNTWWEREDYTLRDDFYKSCIDLDTMKKNNFKWDQSKFTKAIIVKNTKEKLSETNIGQLQLDSTIKKEATYWIKEWNKSSVEDRLINYSSIPIFSQDKNYVLIVRGQDVRSEGGWDSIYIYKKEGNTWTVWKEVIVTTI